MMYIAHIAWSFGLILVASGFIALHFAGREKSGQLKIAGWLLVVGGTLGLICNAYYSLKYLQQGAFERPMMMRPMSGGPMRGGMMQNGMPSGSMMPGNSEPPSPQ
jgi:hypothetical protein